MEYLPNQCFIAICSSLHLLDVVNLSATSKRNRRNVDMLMDNYARQKSQDLPKIKLCYGHDVDINHIKWIQSGRIMRVYVCHLFQSMFLFFGCNIIEYKADSILQPISSLIDNNCKYKSITVIKLYNCTLTEYEFLVLRDCGEPSLHTLLLVNVKLGDNQEDYEHLLTTVVRSNTQLQRLKLESMLWECSSKLCLVIFDLCPSMIEFITSSCWHVTDCRYVAEWMTNICMTNSIRRKIICKMYIDKPTVFLYINMRYNPAQYLANWPANWNGAPALHQFKLVVHLKKHRYIVARMFDYVGTRFLNYLRFHEPSTLWQECLQVKMKSKSYWIYTLYTR